MALAFGQCNSINCTQIGTLQCPTCLKIGIKDSYFCSQVRILQNLRLDNMSVKIKKTFLLFVEKNNIRK